MSGRPKVAHARAPQSCPLRVAVIGSGAAGLAAGWSLSRHHDVTLFEADGRLGGHAHTVDVDLGGKTFPVDTGFIVYNEVNYPSLTAAFAELGVETEASNMSFSVSQDEGRFEYSGRWPGGLFAQRRNLASPRYWRMLADIRRFYSRAVNDLAPLERNGTSLGDYIAQSGYSATFRDRHLLPMVGAIWSTPTGSAQAMPAAAVIRFFHGHGLLKIKNRPQWRTVTGGSRNYVERLMADFRGQALSGRPVDAVLRHGDKVTIRVKGKDALEFDHVVIATHADQALRLLDTPSADEARILGAFQYGANRVILHTDARLMPARRAAWASWNFIETPDGGQGVTYWMNLLQNLETPRPLFVTLNPPKEPDPALVLGAYAYDHPVFDQDAIAAQPSLDALQGRNRTWFCGSYFGYGFHEDAFASGLAAASKLSAAAASPRREPAPSARRPVHA